MCGLPRWQLNVNVNWPTLLKELTGLCVLPRWRMNVNVNSLGSDSPPLCGEYLYKECPALCETAMSRSLRFPERSLRCGSFGAFSGPVNAPTHS